MDLRNTLIFDRFEAMDEPQIFKHAYNRGLRNARIIFYENDQLMNMEYFEILVANPSNVELLNWIYDLLVERPDAVEQLMSNPFSTEIDVLNEICEIIGRKIESSYVIQLRIFYKWVSTEINIMLR